jgi:hypothetical protein
MSPREKHKSKFAKDIVVRDVKVMLESRNGDISIYLWIGISAFQSDISTRISFSIHPHIEI